MTAPARPRYRVVIVGAGIVGLYTSYYLARAGAGPILVIDRGFLSGGASGRNGGGVRQQWETRATVRLAREAIRETAGSAPSSATTSGSARADTSSWPGLPRSSSGSARSTASSPPRD